MVHLEKVTFGYKERPIFVDFSWEAQRGDTWVILGPTGCGKTTLLYLLSGLLRPQQGRILINNKEITRPTPRIGLILQDQGLLPWATVEENISLGLRINSKAKIKDQGVKKAIGEWIEKLGLGSVRKNYPGQLSGGQRQLVAIARTLILKPSLLLMDEPFSSLDVSTREYLQEITLRLVCEDGLTLIFVTHSVEEAVLMGKNILLFKETPLIKAEIIENPVGTRLDLKEKEILTERIRAIGEKLR